MSYKRVIVVHSYLAEHDDEVGRGEAPRNLDWGVRALRDQGFDVVVAHPGRGRSWLRRALSPLLGRIGHPAMEWRIWRMARPSDVLYSVTGDLLLLPLLRSLGLFRPRIVGWSYTAPPRAPWHNVHRWKQLPLFLRGIDAVCCLTPLSAAWARAQMRHARVVALYWGVDTRFYFPAPARPPSWFVCCGRAERDFATLIEALRGSSHRVKMVVLRAALDGLALSQNVELAGESPDRRLGYRELTSQVYAPAAAFLIPLLDSPNNASGYTNLLEAMAMGKPVIMTRTGCLDIDIEREQIGIYVAPNDPDGWRRAMDRISNDPAAAEAMGARARRLAEERFSYEGFGLQLARIIGEAQG